MTLTIGSLCTGYGGLDMAVEQVLDARTAWVSDIDKGACKVLAHRYPGVPNIGDMTAVDWSSVEPVDVITGGTPCQDLSHAGKRAGMTEGTRSNLWVAMREAIATIRPRLVIWENVGGALSAEADSELVRDARLLAGVRRRPGHPLLRAAARVVGDLSSLGYLGGVHALRAADVGAPHGRLRVFVVAVAADADREGRGGIGWPVGRDADRRRGPHRPGAAGESTPLFPSPRTIDTNGAGHHGEGGLDLRTAVSLLGTPTARDHKGTGPVGSKSYEWLLDHGNVEAQVLSLLPTPAVNDMGAAYTPDEWDAWTARMKAEHGNGNGHGKSLNIEALRLLPTPSTGETPNGHGRRGGARGNGRQSGADLDAIAKAQQWGQYAAAIARWETIVGPAPSPTERDWEKWGKRKDRRLASTLPAGMRGSLRFILDGPPPRLSADFTTWMMGLPAGWITDTPGITRNEALKLCGNGVVPQQAAAAIRFLLGVIGEQVAA